MIRRTVEMDIDEEFICFKMRNGLDVCIRKGSGHKAAILAVGYGSMDIEFKSHVNECVISVPRGTAYFLKDMIFSEKILERFLARGAWINSHTSAQSTCYSVWANDNFEQCLELLIKCVFRPEFSKQDVDSIRLKNANEITINFGTTFYRLYYNLLNGLFGNNPIKYPITGDSESILDIDDRILKIVHEGFYHPGNMILVITGEVEESAIIRIIKRVINKYAKIKAKTPLSPVYPMDHPNINKKEIKDFMLLAEPVFALGFRTNNPDHNNYLKHRVMGDMAGRLFAAEGSSLYSELYQKGLVYNDYMTEYAMGSNYGFFMIGGRTGNLRKSISVITNELKKKREELWEIEDFEREKRKSLANLIRCFDSPEKMASELVWLHFNGYNYLDIYNEIQSVTHGDIYDYFRNNFTEDRISLSVINPIRGVRYVK